MRLLHAIATPINQHLQCKRAVTIFSYVHMPFEIALERRQPSWKPPPEVGNELAEHIRDELLAAEYGILMCSGEAFHVFKDVQASVLDKTGTLTEGRPAVVNCLATNLDANEVLRLAVSAKVLMDDKTEEVRRRQQQAQKVAMVDDGINDALALIQAEVVIDITGRESKTVDRHILKA